MKVETPPEFLYRLCREIMFPYCIMRNAVKVCYAQLIFLMYGGKRNFSLEEVYASLFLFNIHGAINTNCRVLSELRAFKTSRGKTSHQINLPSSGNSILFAFANVLYVAVIALKQISASSSSQD